MTNLIEEKILPERKITIELLEGFELNIGDKLKIKCSEKNWCVIDNVKCPEYFDQNLSNYYKSCEFKELKIYYFSRNNILCKSKKNNGECLKNIKKYLELSSNNFNFLKFYLVNGMTP